MRLTRLTLRAALLAVTIGLLTATAALASNGGVAPPQPESPNTSSIQDVYWLILVITGVIFLIVEGALILFVVKYRRGRRSRTADGAQVHGNTRLEIGWTIVPVLIVATIFGFVFASLPDITTVPKASAANTVDVTVEGHQFYWLFRYPGGEVAIDRMVVPVGAVVNETVIGVDVIHGWWIPQLSPQIDAIPGRVNHQWFKADKVGTYKGQCAQLCGIKHAQMLGEIKVVTRDRYDAFLAAHKPGSPVVAKEAFVGVCSKCHGMNGVGDYGPPLQNRDFQTSDITSLLQKGRCASRGCMPAVGSNWDAAMITGMIHYLRQTKGGATLGH
jgi:cytochrome c oxidase subunit 2